MAKTKMHAVEGRPGELLSTEEALARAAIGCFSARGFAATSIQDIATAAGVSKGNIYHYFASKDEVLRLIINGVLDDLLASYESIPYDELGFAAQLRTFVRTMVAFVAENRDETAIFVQERRLLAENEAFVDLAARSDRAVTSMTTLLEQGIAGGHVRELVSPKAMALGLIGMATWVYQWYSPGRNSPDKIGDLYATIVLDGLRIGRSARQNSGIAALAVDAPSVEPASSTRDALLRSAMEQFVDKGYANTSISALATGAGVTTGAVYSQFASKDEILRTIMGRFLDRLGETMNAAVEANLPAPETLDRLIVAMFGEVGDHHTELTIFLQEFRYLKTAAYADLQQKSSDLVATFVRVLDAGVEQGVFRDMFSLEVMADGLLGLCAFPFLWMEPGEQLPEGTAAMFAEVVLAGLVRR